MPNYQNYLNSVERGRLFNKFVSKRCSNKFVDRLIVAQYSQAALLQQEAPHEIPEAKPPTDWPPNGSINFENLTLRYRPGLPNVLEGISMSIRGGEKIGIVGRTGAGKSSITLALLRIVEYTGSITIDGYVMTSRL